MKWDTAADAKLFACVMKVYDVKITGTKLEEVAALMGEDCTPKAITHRLSKLRNTAALDSPGPSAPSTPTSSRVRASATPRRSISKSVGKRSTNKASTKGKRPIAASNDAETMGVYDDQDDEEVFKLPGKRLFKAELGEEESGAVKKVKEEVFEVEGFDDVEVVEA